MTAMGVLVSSDIIGYTVDGTKIVRTIVTASDTQTGSVAFQIDKIRALRAETSGYCGFHIASTSSLVQKGPATIPVTLSGAGYTNQLAVTPSAASNAMVLRFLIFERDS
jgi:hypothetical protein